MHISRNHPFSGQDQQLQLTNWRKCSRLALLGWLTNLLNSIYFIEHHPIFLFQFYEYCRKKHKSAEKKTNHSVWFLGMHGSAWMLARSSSDPFYIFTFTVGRAKAHIHTSFHILSYSLSVTQVVCTWAELLLMRVLVFWIVKTSFAHFIAFFFYFQFLLVQDSFLTAVHFHGCSCFGGVTTPWTIGKKKKNLVLKVRVLSQFRSVDLRGKKELLQRCKDGSRKSNCIRTCS